MSDQEHHNRRTRDGLKKSYIWILSRLFTPPSSLGWTRIVYIFTNWNYEKRSSSPFKKTTRNKSTPRSLPSYSNTPASLQRTTTPLPHDAITISGGCNCKALRYQVSIPPHDKRPPNPYRSPGADIGDLRIPFVALCHCNDCRAATPRSCPQS